MRHILLLPFMLAASASAHPLPIPHGHEAALSSPTHWPVMLGLAAVTAVAVLLVRKRSH